MSNRNHTQKKNRTRSSGNSESKKTFFVLEKHPVAIMVDGSFFLKRFRSLHDEGEYKPQRVAQILHDACHKHLGKTGSLYRIFYYDCLPIDKRGHHPITNKAINWSKTPEAIFRKELFQELRKKRKVALRLGWINSTNNWLIRVDVTKKLLKKEMEITDLQESDVFYELNQKGVDIKIGLDIASLAYKEKVKKIVLISGDSDFVPAAKLARREGIDFVLDPMWRKPSDDLYEHIDGLVSVFPKPRRDE